MNYTWRVSWVGYGDIAVEFVKFSWITRVLELRLITFQVKAKFVRLIYYFVFESVKGIIEIFKFEEFMWDLFIPLVNNVSLNWIVKIPVVFIG